jgi:ParB family chromosome partitioning protein
VRQVENIVALRGTKPAAQKAASKAPVDANVRAAALELERTLGTRVKILGDGRQGKIEISYFSAEDLNRIYDLIVRQ